MFMQIAETVWVHVFMQIAETAVGSRREPTISFTARLQTCLNECLPQIGVALLIAKLAALLRWDVSEETLRL
jgi:hypothetical protein